jgi:uncharacterized membrane protein YfcA
LLLSLSVPLAFVGGAIQLPGQWYKQAVGLVLIRCLAPLPRHTAAERHRVGSRRQCRSLGALPSNVWLWSGIVGGGGLIGSELGSRRVAVTTFSRLLAAVLLVAGLKLLLLL